MTDQQAQPGRLGQLLARLRQAGPKRPRWWHFAPHAVLVVGLAAGQFFYTALRNMNRFPNLEPFCIVLFFGLPLVLLPVSLLHALWKWFLTRSLCGAVWLLRPALLCLAFLALLSPLRGWGMKWDFERQLYERNQAVGFILSATPELPSGSAPKLTALPEGFRHLSSDGEVLVTSANEATTITFFTSAAEYVYSTGESIWRTPAYGWYDQHWYMKLL